jgi:hypothetical protein
MKKLLFFLITLSAAFAAGCKIDDPGTGLKGNVYNTYQPITKGTVWKYAKNDVVAGAETETQTMTGGKSVYEKKIYYTVRTQTTAGEDTLTRYCHDGNDYYLSNESATGGFRVEYLYLKEDHIAGRVWTANVTPDGLIQGTPARIQGVVMEKNKSTTISGTKFTNVIHTRLQFQYDQGNGFETIETIDYYIAKGIGIIQVEYSEGGTIKSNKIVTDYDIK